jgi:hypothetical protein
MMNVQSYRILFGAGLAVLAGIVGAQSGSDMSYPSSASASQSTTRLLGQSVLTDTDNASPTAQLPVSRDMADPEIAASPQTIEKQSSHSNVRGQASNEAGAHTSGQKAARQAHHHIAKRASQPHRVAARGETTYRHALRKCVKEQDQDQRDSCLDRAIEQFQRTG